MCRYRLAEERALELGAVKVGHYYTETKRYNHVGGLELCKEIFSSHFFNAEGLEVGYYHHIIRSRLTQMMPPRVWGPEALSHLTFEPLVSEAKPARQKTAGPVLKTQLSIDEKITIKGKLARYGVSAPSLVRLNLDCAKYLLWKCAHISILDYAKLK